MSSEERERQLYNLIIEILNFFNTIDKYHVGVEHLQKTHQILFCYNLLYRFFSFSITTTENMRVSVERLKKYFLSDTIASIVFFYI